MAMFVDRKDAGRLLAKALVHYRGKDNVIVLGLPRGGLPLAAEIASYLRAPLDLAFAHKIGHPQEREYAVAAISESGYLAVRPEELKYLDQKWLEKEKEETLAEIKKRRKLYLKGKQKPILAHKIVILVDDGVATGLTLQAAIQEIKSFNPKKLVVAVPVAPQSTAALFQEQSDEFVALRIDQDSNFLGSVGAYYDDFSQVSDQEVINLLEQAQLRAKENP